MPSLFQFEILTPEKIAFSGVISSLVAPAQDGYFGVWAHHAPLIARSSGGRLKIRQENTEERTFQVGPGMVEVLKNKVLFLTKYVQFI